MDLLRPHSHEAAAELVRLHAGDAPPVLVRDFMNSLLAAYRPDEVARQLLASGLGIIPRLGASLAKLSHNPDLLMTDSEAYLVEEPVPVGPRGDFQPKVRY